MSWLNARRSCARFSFISLILVFGASVASRSAAQPGDDAAPTPVLQAVSGGIEGLMPDETDRPLRQALAALPPRFDRLPGELPNAQEAAPFLMALPILSRLALNPMTLEIALGAGGEDHQGPPPVGVSISIAAGAGGEPRELEELLLGVFDVLAGPASEPDERGLRTLAGPAGDILLGVTNFEGDDRLVVSMGAGAIAPARVGGPFDLPENASRAGALHFDLAPLSPMIEAALANAPDSERWIDLLRSLHLTGDEALSIEAVWGLSPEEGVGLSRIDRFGAMYDAMGVAGDAQLSEHELRMIPREVTSVWAAVMSVDWIVPVVEFFAGLEPEAPNPFDMLNDQFGIDVRRDLIEPLGDRIITYKASSTGGGMTSTVVIISLDDAERIDQLHERLVSMANGILAERARGYVQFRQWETPAGELAWSLTTPGLPVPFEPSWIFTREHLVIALSPRGLVEARAQLSNPGASILDHSAVASMIAVSDGPLVGLQFVDDESALAGGYPAVNLLMSGLINAGRSPTDPAAGAAALAPALVDLRRVSQPIIGVSFREGDALVTHSRASRSMTANLATALGSSNWSSYNLYQYSVMAGVMLPALGRARGNAQQIKSGAQLQQMLHATISFRIDNGRMPRSIDELIDAQLITPDMLISPRGPASDGGPDYAIRFDVDWAESFDFEWLVAVERASVINGDVIVNVGFADGHVEEMTITQISELLAQSKSLGAAEALQLPLGQ